MRIANLAGNAVLLIGDGFVDLEQWSNGRFGPDPLSLYDRWDEFNAWASMETPPAPKPFDPAALQAPLSNPRQIFAIGLNYRDHASEAALAEPDDLVVFTKFASSLAGPYAEVVLPSDRVDYEAELVVVIGRRLHRVDAIEARTGIAGFSVGQDFSERRVQTRGPAPQFSLGKSYPGFAPFGPAVVTLDEIATPDALHITADLDGPSSTGHGGPLRVQDGTTVDLIFPVDRIISDLSQVVTLFPGDIIFTGTPAGVGSARGLFLKPGDTLTTTIEGVGTLRNAFVSES